MRRVWLFRTGILNFFNDLQINFGNPWISWRIRKKIGGYPHFLGGKISAPFIVQCFGPGMGPKLAHRTLSWSFERSFNRHSNEQYQEKNYRASRQYKISRLVLSADVPTWDEKNDWCDFLRRILRALFLGGIDLQTKEKYSEISLNLWTVDT